MEVDACTSRGRRNPGRLYADEDSPFGAVQTGEPGDIDIFTVQEADAAESLIRRAADKTADGPPFSPTTIVITNVSTGAAKRM